MRTVSIESIARAFAVNSREGLADTLDTFTIVDPDTHTSRRLSADERRRVTRYLRRTEHRATVTAARVADSHRKAQAQERRLRQDEARAAAAHRANASAAMLRIAGAQ